VKRELVVLCEILLGNVCIAGADPGISYRIIFSRIGGQRSAPAAASLAVSGRYRAAGGPFTLKGDDYEETPEYGFSEDFNLIKGKPQSFKAKIEGNKWYHDGKLSNGLTIEEVWERVEKK
jgi:hypothetical protein